MEPLIYVNGRFFKKSKAMVSVFDHGLLYGDGVFETLRAHGGKILFLNRHLKRLMISASAISLQIGQTIPQLKDILYQTLFKNNLKDAYLRITITRGQGELGLDPVLCPTPTIIVMGKAFTGHPEELYQQGIRASLVFIRRNAPKTTDPSIKSLNFLNNILAKQETVRSGAGEAIMLNIEGLVCEGSISNVFWVKERTLKTPHPRCGLLEGVTREAVIRIAHLVSLSVAEGYFPPQDLLSADEVFITNTTYEIMPVTYIDQKPVKDGKVGEVTKFLLQEYRHSIPEFLAEG